MRHSTTHIFPWADADGFQVQKVLVAIGSAWNPTCGGARRTAHSSYSASNFQGVNHLASQTDPYGLSPAWLLPLPVPRSEKQGWGGFGRASRVGFLWAPVI